MSSKCLPVLTAALILFLIAISSARPDRRRGRCYHQIRRFLSENEKNACTRHRYKDAHGRFCYSCLKLKKVQSIMFCLRCRRRLNPRKYFS